MELCNDCIENCCDDCAEIDCKCNQTNHTVAPMVLVRDALSALNSETAYVNSAEIVPGQAETTMQILVNGNIFQVTVKTIRCEKPNDPCTCDHDPKDHSTNGCEACSDQGEFCAHMEFDRD